MMIGLDLCIWDLITNSFTTISMNRHDHEGLHHTNYWSSMSNQSIFSFLSTHICMKYDTLLPHIQNQN